MDKRNHDVTNKIFEVLNKVKGFDVAIRNPKTGKLLIRHNNINFYVTIEPVYNDNETGKKRETEQFDKLLNQIIGFLINSYRKESQYNDSRRTYFRIIKFTIRR